MRYLHGLGLVNTLADYEALPLFVLEDARLLMEAEGNARKLAEAEARRGKRR